MALWLGPPRGSEHDRKAVRRSTVGPRGQLDGTALSLMDTDAFFFFFFSSTSSTSTIAAVQPDNAFLMMGLDKLLF
jgi:hypothetical protein